MTINTYNIDMPCPWYLFIPVYYFLSIIYLLFGVYNKGFSKCVLKCIPVAVLLFQVLAILAEYARSVEVQAGKIVGIKQFLLGIAFSAIGDGCLAFPRPRVFMAGIISFTVSICFYISVLGLMESVVNITFVGVASGVCIYTMSFAITLLFKNIMDTKLPAKYLLIAMILLYFLLLSTLLWSGVLFLLRQNSLAGICSAIGTAMFYTSDVLIAASAILDLRLLKGRALVMLTYYSAQLLLAISLHLSLQHT